MGSTCVSLKPGALTGGYHTADTHTAGSCMLLAQARARHATQASEARWNALEVCFTDTPSRTAGASHVMD